MACARPNTTPSNPRDLNALDRTLKDRVWTLMVDAPALGLTLISGYRDPGRQWDLRRAHGCRGRECDRTCRGTPVTAVPGSSNHQRRLAADLGGRDLQWAINVRAAYGLGLTVRSENWHFEAAGVDARTGRRIGAPTVRILRFPDGLGPISMPTQAMVDTYRRGTPPAPPARPPAPPSTPKDWYTMATEADLRRVVDQAISAASLARQPTIVQDSRTGTNWIIDGTNSVVALPQGQPVVDYLAILGHSRPRNHIIAGNTPEWHAWIDRVRRTFGERRAG